MAERRARDVDVLDRVRLHAGGVLDGDDALVGGLVGERGAGREVAYRVDPVGGGLLAAVDLELAALAELEPDRGEVQRVDVGAAAAGDRQVVDLEVLIAGLQLDRVRPPLDALDLRPGQHLNPLLLEGALDDPDDVLVLGGKDLVEHLDQRDLGPEARVGGRNFRARCARSDDRQLLRQLGERPGSPGVEDAVAELDAGNGQRHRARASTTFSPRDVPADLDFPLRR